VGKPPNISGIFIGFYMNLLFEFALSQLYSSGQNPSGSEADGGRFEGMAGGTKISRSVDFEDFPGGKWSNWSISHGFPSHVYHV
jgi:hypothetical protein